MFLTKRTPLLAAEEGDVTQLCAKLRNQGATLTARERRFVADVLDGTRKLPKHRPASVLTRVRQIDMARRVDELVDGGEKLSYAVGVVADEYGCSASTVHGARRARVKKVGT